MENIFFPITSYFQNLENGAVTAWDILTGQNPLNQISQPATPTTNNTINPNVAAVTTSINWLSIAVIGFIAYKFLK